MAKPRLTKSILADLTERYKSALGKAAKGAILDEYSDYSVPKALAPKAVAAKSKAAPAAKALAKAVAKPRKKSKPFRGKYPTTWKQVRAVRGIDKVSDHSGDSRGQVGPSRSRKRRTNNPRSTTATRKTAAAKKRKRNKKSKQSRKRR